MERCILVIIFNTNATFNSFNSSKVETNFYENQ